MSKMSDVPTSQQPLGAISKIFASILTIEARGSTKFIRGLTLLSQESLQKLILLPELIRQDEAALVSSAAFLIPFQIGDTE